MNLLLFLLLLLALILVLRAESLVFTRLRLATVETVRGIVFIITLGRVRMRPRVMAARSRHKERLRNLRYWFEDRRMGDIVPEYGDPIEDDPYGKWITTGNQTADGIGGVEGLRQASLDDYSHLSNLNPLEGETGREEFNDPNRDAQRLGDTDGNDPSAQSSHSDYSVIEDPSENDDLPPPPVL